MAQRNVTPDERAEIESYQKNIEAAKKHLRRAENDMQRLYALLKEAGEVGASGAAFRVKANTAVASGYAELAHSSATDALLDCYVEDDAGPIVFGGGGR